MLHLAAVDPVAAIGLGWTIVCGGIGGIVGGLATAFLLGRKLGTYESRLETAELAVEKIDGRLSKGDDRFDELVRIGQIAKDLSTDLRATQRSLAELSGKMGEVVTKPELEKEQAKQQRFCDLRHSKAGA